MENIVISNPGGGTCPAAHCGGGDNGANGVMAMLIMLTFALATVAFLVVASRCLLRPASIDNEDYENAMLNASVPTLVTVQNLYASAKRRGIAFGSDMEEADLLRSKCGIAIARVMANIRDEMNADTILLSPEFFTLFKIHFHHGSHVQRNCRPSCRKGTAQEGL